MVLASSDPWRGDADRGAARVAEQARRPTLFPKNSTAEHSVLEPSDTRLREWIGSALPAPTALPKKQPPPGWRSMKCPCERRKAGAQRHWRWLVLKLQMLRM